jgi:osmotically-inducible protein OsmY
MDSNITESDIIKTLSTQTNNGVSSLTVRLDDGHMVIGGQARSYYVKQVVTQTALANAGSRQVRNEIHVSPQQTESVLYN